jgi:hypothetical protein
MKSDKSPRLAGKPKREFGGSVELIPARPDYTEFIDAHRIWAFPISYLTHLLFQENPKSGGQKTLPPDQLVLVYTNAVVVLRGWRLELIISSLVTGRVARVHAEKHLGPLMLEESWVSEIHVLLRDDTILDHQRLERWISDQS